MLRGWTLFEKLWLLIFTVVNVYLLIVWKSTLLSFISSITGIFCVVLVAKGKIANYYFGIVQTATYAYVSYQNHLYGETMLNALFYLPVQFIGIYLWSRHKTSEAASNQGEEIPVLRLTAKGWYGIIGCVVAGTLLYALILDAIKGKFVLIDSSIVALSVTAQILMLRRYAEQWVLWIAVNMLSIVLWAVALSSSGSNDYNILVMWTAFLINSVYGYYNWSKRMVRDEVSPA